MSTHSDRELVEQAKRGDGAAVGELFSRYWRAARAAAFGVTGEFASAEDAASEAFRQALVGIDSLRDPDRFGAWLRTIVVRRARLAFHNRHDAAEPLADHLSVTNETPDTVLEQLELGAVIQHAIRDLPDRLREAVALFYFEGYDSDAAARFLDIPAGTLRRRLHDGRAQLRTAVEKILRGRNSMNDDRVRQIERFKSLLDNGETYQALRESLALRPVPHELIHSFMHRQAATAGSNTSAKALSELALRLLHPSERASDLSHPVGSTAAAIRKVLSHFQDWPHIAGKAAERFFSFSADYRERLQSMLPPGFAEGRPGAFIRPSRALVYLNDEGSVNSAYERLQGSPDEQAFRTPKNRMRMSDVFDLTWMVAGTLELRSVHEMLQRVVSTVLPDAQARFSSYDEPRYRSALQLHVDEISARAAHGGVLADWPGHPQGVQAAHVRIFLEPWATLRTGHVVELDELPKIET